MTNFVAKSPNDCEEKELDNFENYVKQGGEVDDNGLRGRMMKAEWLLFLYDENGILAGVAALKCPEEGYKRNVFNKARSKENPDEFPFEAGWIYIKPEFRGNRFSHVLLEKIIELAGDKPLYATTREDNKPMKSTNIRYGLQQSGHPYPSVDRKHNLVLYVKRT